MEMTVNEAASLLARQHQYFQTQVTKPLAFRVEQLRKLKAGLKKYEAQFIEALNQDLGKCENESYMTEIGLSYHSIDIMLKQLKKWMKPHKVVTPVVNFPAKSYIVREPYGSALIIGPYNYPYQLLFEPLIGAIAAGNTAVLKPSEISANFSRVAATMIHEIFTDEFIAVVEGAVATNTALLAQPFDYIFFTGSVPVGKIVMAAASKHLTPVTLELGGKSPVIVDETANLKVAAERIIWGKTINSGQTCIAPDYLMVHQDVKAQLITEMKLALKTFYGDDIEQSKSFARMISDKQFNRVTSLLDDSSTHIVAGGKRNAVTRYIEPTLAEVDDFSAALMQDEIFGPVLPIVTFTSLADAITQIKTLPKPLALYVFTENKKSADQVLHEISSGGACVNNTIMHITNPNLPFGGVGPAGIGNYHGEHSFNTFSHERGVLKSSTKFPIRLIFPPYNLKQLKIVKWIYK
ncbi:aldehyde dehydrogenase [Periweissella cryptocerci]|uniref:Aldehyde dehydrogenase n=1 Tax=Periweissella cryptocerci TaxID=2506420 RepID=A0A4P6YVM8_9LACO|nr:aldehyde dehydrogenase [Periweissella cryptocerci]QBO36831.1 aldehyde dehydrogenase [Periweissella cryptocerci]